MARLRSLYVLTLFSAVACASGGDDDIVQIRDSGVRDAGEVIERDGGTIDVELRTLAASYTTQGCSNGCVIGNYRINVTLGNLSEYFPIKRITGLKIEIGTFEFMQTDLDCDGAWWKAPKSGSTTAQRFNATVFDVEAGDTTRPDNANVSWDCKSSMDGQIMNMYGMDDTPTSSDQIRATIWGELDDGTTWMVMEETTANMN